MGWTQGGRSASHTDLPPVLPSLLGAEIEIGTRTPTCLLISSHSLACFVPSLPCCRYQGMTAEEIQLDRYKKFRTLVSHTGSALHSRPPASALPAACARAAGLA